MIFVTGVTLVSFSVLSMYSGVSLMKEGLLVLFSYAVQMLSVNDPINKAHA